MKNVIAILSFLFLIACKETKIETVQKEEIRPDVSFDQALVTTLEKMTEIDQLYAGIPQGNIKEIGIPGW